MPLQVLQGPPCDSRLRLPVIAGILCLTRSVNEAKRVKHVKRGLCQTGRGLLAPRELNRVCDPWTACQEWLDSTWIGLPRTRIRSNGLQKFERLLGCAREEQRDGQRDQV